MSKISTLLKITKVGKEGSKSISIVFFNVFGEKLVTNKETFLYNIP